MNVWSRLKTNLEKQLDFKDLSEYEKKGDKKHLRERQIYEGGGTEQEEFQIENKPIEPEGKKLKSPSMFKWVLFVLFVVYILISYYHAPILTRLGRYLVIEHPLTKADLIVSLMGKPVERGLAAEELYKKGLASHIFVGREKVPDGYSHLIERGVHYPEERDLLIMMLKGLGVPESAIITNDSFIEGTLGEAKIVREISVKRGYRSLIIVTSPTHTRRSWLTFRKVFEKEDTKIMMMPSRYSNFKAEDWWKTREFVKEVIIEYQKLVYYIVKYF